MLTWSFGCTRVYVAPRRAEDLGGAVRQHFVRVHVVRRSGAGLIDVDDELIAQAALEDLVGGGDDGARDLPIEPSERGVGFGSRLLDQHGGRDQLGRRGQAADREVLDRALRLERRSMPSAGTRTSPRESCLDAEIQGLAGSGLDPRSPCRAFRDVGHFAQLYCSDAALLLRRAWSNSSRAPRPICHLMCAPRCAPRSQREDAIVARRTGAERSSPRTSIRPRRAKVRSARTPGMPTFEVQACRSASIRSG